MTIRSIMLSGVAALTLISCGQSDDGASGANNTEAARTNASSPLDSTYRLKDGEQVDITALLALFPSDTPPTYESAAFDDALGANVITNLRFADADDGEAVIVERTEFYGVDLDALERVKTAAPSDDGAFETIFEKIRFLNGKSEGYTEEGESLLFSFAGIELDKLQVREGGLSDENDAAIFDAISLAGVYAKDISLNVAPEDQAAVVFNAPDLRIVGIGGGKVDAVIAKDIDYTVAQTDASREVLRQAMGPSAAFIFSGPLKSVISPDNQEVSMQLFEWRDIDFSGLLPWTIKEEQPPFSEKNLLDLGTMKMVDIETSISGKRVYSMGEATVSALEFTWLAPSKIRMDVKDAFYDYTAFVPEDAEDIFAAFQESGLDQVKGEGHFEWLWDEKSGKANMDYEANAEGFADFDMKLELGELELADIERAAESGDPTALAALGTFDGFSLSLDDEKALDAIFSVAALQFGGSAEDLRQSAPAMIRLSGLQAAQFNDRIPGYLGALADFVSEGGKLTISAKPKTAITFNALQAQVQTAPQDLPDVLNLTVTHEE